MKIHPAGAKLLHADGWMDGWMEGGTDRQGEANSHFLQFCECA